MQSVDVTTQIPGGSSESFTLTRKNRFAQWGVLEQPWILYPIRPGQTYTHGDRTITCSQPY